MKISYEAMREFMAECLEKSRVGAIDFISGRAEGRLHLCCNNLAAAISHWLIAAKNRTIRDRFGSEIEAPTLADKRRIILARFIDFCLGVQPFPLNRDNACFWDVGTSEQKRYNDDHKFRHFVTSLMQGYAAIMLVCNR